MRLSLPSAFAAIAICVLFTLTSGCSGGSPFDSGFGLSAGPVTTPVTDPVTQPVTPVTTTPSGPTSSVAIMISDPAACKTPNGPLSHVYVSIADIKGSTNPDAASGDSSFVDLTPGLSSAPQQVDLLGQANSKCFLASLSATAQVAAGNYQQLRMYLVPDSAAGSVANNACGSLYANCIVRSDHSLYDLQLAPATAQGIKISSGQIANAGLALNANETPSIDVDFDTCSSILTTANGGYEFNPAVHAGLVPSNGGSISGSVVSSKTGKPLQGGQTVVALEQKDARTGVDRILMRTDVSSNGTFVLCPVPQGSYDLVAVGVDGANVAYSAGIEEGIQSGQVAGQIPLVPGSAQGTLQGLVTTQSSGQPPVGVDVAVRADALQTVDANGVTITVPLLPSQSPYNDAMLTATSSTCPSGADCSNFAMHLPAIAPNVVTCSENTAPFRQQKGAATYIAESIAEITGSGGIPDCATSDLSQSATAQGSSLVLNPDRSMTAKSMSYTQCQ
jgi:Domain of unknown function (DUF4382)